VGVLTAGQTRSALGLAAYKAAQGDGDGSAAITFSGEPTWVGESVTADAVILGFAVAEGDRFAYDLSITIDPDGLTYMDITCDAALDDTGAIGTQAVDDTDAPYLTVTDSGTFVAASADTVFTVTLGALVSDVQPVDETPPAHVPVVKSAILRVTKLA
jgi:hypothetical protein